MKKIKNDIIDQFLCFLFFIFSNKTNEQTKQSEIITLIKKKKKMKNQLDFLRQNVFHRDILQFFHSSIFLFIK